MEMVSCCQVVGSVGSLADSEGQQLALNLNAAHSSKMEVSATWRLTAWLQDTRGSCGDWGSQALVREEPLGWLVGSMEVP